MLASGTLIVVAALHLATAQLLCYFPNGRQSTDVPCNVSAPVSMCCGSSKACLSNGLCLLDDTTSSSGNSYARGTCTDPQWTSDLCPKQCLLNQDSPDNSSAYDFRSSGVQVWECDRQGYGAEAEYCCESDREKTRCCSTSTAVFKLPAATVGNAVGQVLTTTTTAAAAATATTTISSASQGATSTSEGFATAAATAPAETSTDKPDEPSSGLSVGAIAGIGVGVGVFVAGLALLAAVWFYRRHAKKPKAEVQGEVTSEKYTGVKELEGRHLYEMDGAGVVEAPGEDHRHEMPPAFRVAR
ncbi:hypothetical protein CGCS363_v010377 [Colletotrichum siamense]|uniref:uncharacterized protein n=1 Tax=Colletotrichum siamense TaxID=690259 RepID=UPI001872D386|nr:uncharacterized protein CGCS363_v010377 [Colletotrichum siamense]KAF5491438.1 hypothetical protein CGCS363_v010377 [Colletotrichum siamense]